MADVDIIKLARMLRECAVFVDRNDFHTAMYQVLSDLSAYVAKHPKNLNRNESQGREIQKTNSGTLSTGIASVTNVLGRIGIVEKEKGKASSTKNADRARADLHELYTAQNGSQDSASVSSADRSAAPRKPVKPPFQRASNPESAVIASGWIEQQRRSKFRVVWKDILATIVEARTATQETTLWIQREITNVANGKRELEALHKVPIKWIEEVLFIEHYGDHRFSVKVYNISDEFVFRCGDKVSAQDWVVTLRSVKDNDARRMQELREAAAANVNPVPTAVQADATAAKPIHASPVSAPASVNVAQITEHDSHGPSEAQAYRMSIKEMQAIAQRAGINTHGMERPELERVIAMISTSQRRSSENVPADEAQSDAVHRSDPSENKEQFKESSAGSVSESSVPDDEKRRQLEEAQAQRVAEARRKAAIEEEKRQAMVAEELRQVEEQKKIVEEQMRQAEEQRRRAAEQEQIRRQEEERLRAQQKYQAEQEQLRRQEEERLRAQQKFQAEQEQLRRQEEERLRAQQQYQQAQQQWQAQQAAQQQWQAQQAAAAAQRAHEAQQAAQRAQAAQWQKWQQQQQQQQPPSQQPQAPSDPSTSSADMKYTKMAAESKGAEAVTINVVKRSILTHWALQPPNLLHLRSIADLLISIHTVFPPAFGVPGHDYFKKWTPISRQELIPVGAGADPEKLSKAVKKLRFFLHPDKLPRDLTEEQSFMCRMLWDVSSDAWEEFKKRHEELDWIRS